MANQEHVDRIMKEGVQGWNDWKRKYNNSFRDRLDLTGVDFGQHILEDGKNRTYCNLTGIDLSHVDLMSANLSGANLRYADFSHGPLSKFMERRDFPGSGFTIGVA